MTFEAANALLDEITAFLISCGGVYETIKVDLQRGILESLVYGQYVLRRDAEHNITHFINFFRMRPSQVEAIKKGGYPVNEPDGTMIFIADHGSRDGRLWDCIHEIRRKAAPYQGVFWRHKDKGYKMFSEQRGLKE